MLSQAKVHSRWIELTSFMAAMFAVIFYIATAGATVGHENDFGPLWMGGRILYQGQGESLYVAETQEAILREHGLPLGKLGSPELQNTDRNFQPIGRLPYPPTQALLYLPLATLSPQPAQQLMVYLSLAFAALAAGAIRELFQQRYPYFLILAIVVCQPCFFSTIALGQNAAFTLLVIVGGLWLSKTDRPFLAGLCWGLLAYKPSWGLAVAWVPLLIGQPKIYLGLALSGFGLIGLSLLWVGVETWKEWLEVARQFEEADVPKWLWIRRDLRTLLQQLFPNVSGVFATVLVLVVVPWATYWWAVRRRPVVDHAFLSAGIGLSCLRFMWYDLLVFAPLLLVACGAVVEANSNQQPGTPWVRWICLSLLSLYGLAFLLFWPAWPEVPALETAVLVTLWLLAGRGLLPWREMGVKAPKGV